MARIEFYGVRGSQPTPKDDNLKFGGNTSCVVVYSDEDEKSRFPIIFDLGTGLSRFSRTIKSDLPFNGVSFVTHFHFDHIQGLPFFAPIDRVGAKLKVFAPSESGVNAEESFTQLFSAPYFPIGLNDLRGEISITSLEVGKISLDQPGSPTVRSCLVDHTNVTYGYRLEVDGKVIVYIADHQAPPNLISIEDAVLSLCEGANLLIHDAQYTDSEFKYKAHWGHSTFGFAVEVAVRSGAESLAFYHHDPARSDVELSEIEKHYQKFGDSKPHIFAAREGSTVYL